MNSSTLPLPYHPDRVGCECEKRGLPESAECLYDDPCWTSREAYDLETDKFENDGSYGPGRSAAMSERISFTYDELDMVHFLLTEAREGWEESATEEESEVAHRAHEKVKRAFAKAQRKRRSDG